MFPATPSVINTTYKNNMFHVKLDNGQTRQFKTALLVARYKLHLTKREQSQ